MWVWGIIPGIEQLCPPGRTMDMSPEQKLHRQTYRILKFFYKILFTDKDG
jgi:hypothetical protein